ncbi:hypothetical protein BDN72DRAFT_904447 [Pluteus cervinus]|uniref:Uncharacterized protein n=1 Tax=Pluteus cervinus TaxID=181527 RepID=A0ACD3A5R9_9AGAR|nr:hypothetical protein BDN72DRAFT_904447 [Pluteus cervinus]
MTTIVHNLIHKFFPPKPEPRVTILGLDYGGKTTLLYLLRLGEVVQTIPTLGFNIESFEVPHLATGTGSKKKSTLVGWDTGTGCGRQYMHWTTVMYATYGDALIWVVDSNDKERFKESIDEFVRTVKDTEIRRVKDRKELELEGKKPTYALHPQPILILANKQDKEGCIPIDEIRKHFANAIAAMSPPPPGYPGGGRLYSVFKTSLVRPIDESGLPEAFNWLLFALEAVKRSPPVPASSSSTAASVSTSSTSTPAPSGPTPPGPLNATTMYQRLDSWLTRIYAEQSSPEEFLTQFHAINLPAWDHYTHIRIAFLVLFKHGRQAGKNIIFDGLATYIAQSTQTRGRTFHFTMTYFWIQIVHFGMSSMTHLVAPSSYPTPGGTSNAVPSQGQAGQAVPPLPDSANDEFAKFILINPHVVDGNLWAEYFSKEVMMSPTAKEEMVLPDKKPLPSLVVRDRLKGLS